MQTLFLYVTVSICDHHATGSKETGEPEWWCKGVLHLRGNVMCGHMLQTLDHWKGGYAWLGGQAGVLRALNLCLQGDPPQLQPLTQIYSGCQFITFSSFS